MPKSKQKFSKLDLPLWPEDGITKQDLICYYDRISPALLPHLKNRLIMLERHPEGVGGRWFYQKDTLAEETPKWVTTAQVWAAGRDEGSRYISYHVGADRDQLLHYAELCALTLHASATTAESTDFPDQLFIDLDPFGVPFSTVQRVALMVKATLDELGRRGYLKTSGATGLTSTCP